MHYLHLRNLRRLDFRNSLLVLRRHRYRQGNCNPVIYCCHFHFSQCTLLFRRATCLLDDHRALEPPDPIPNSDVKRCLADGSVGFPHVRVGHRQAFIAKPQPLARLGLFCVLSYQLCTLQHFQLRNLG